MVIACAAAAGTAKAQSAPSGGELVLAEKGRSTYRIVLAANAPPATRFAAEELQRFLKEISGAELPVVTDAEAPLGHEILVGDSRRLRRAEPDFDANRYGAEGYRLHVAGGDLVIAGGRPRGDLYGVYGLLEDHLGCRWFTPQISRIPKADRLALAPLDETRSPVLEYREVMLFDCWDANWMARNRLSTSTRFRDDARGGTVRFVPDYAAHTFSRLVPPEKYFASHPEYFSEANGVRQRAGGQLCGTSEEVARVVAERAGELLRQHPEAKIISVSQNDNKAYCQCARCRALDANEGTHAAQVLCLVNRVAEAVAKEFPDRAVDTFAYEWSQAPPRTMRVRDNVVVRLSTIRCSFSQPIGAARGGQNRVFQQDLEGWAKICKRLWIWDYTTYFSWYLVPFPDWRVLDENIRFFVGHGVTGVLEENNWQSVGSEMAPLKGYMLAKFLWDPNYGRGRAMNEFLQGVYGPAATPVRAYLDLLCDKVDSEKIPLPIYGSRTPPWLAGDVLEKADKLWEQAESAVADMPDFLRRVRIARLSTDYALIEKYRFKPENMIVYDGDPRKGKVLRIDPGYERRIRRFLEVSKDAGITHLREGEPDVAANVKWLTSLLPPTPQTSPAASSAAAK
jgi:hypothetical protein